MIPAGKVPIRESIGAALRFVREQWKLAFFAGGAGAAAHFVAFLIAGTGLFWMLVILAVSATTYAAFCRAALSGTNDLPKEMLADTPRLAAAMGIVAFFIGIVALMIVYVAMSVLIAPYASEVTAAGEDQARLAEIMNAAVTAQPNVVLAGALVGVALIFLLTTRFYVAAPASVDRGRISVFESWRMTGGNTLRIMGVRIALMLPAAILTGALQSLVAVALGFGGGDPFAIATAAQGDRMGFALYYAAALFVQIAFYSALEAGLSAYLYRGLKPASAPSPT